MVHPIIGVSSATSWVNIYGSLVRQVTALSTAMLQPLLDNGAAPVLLSSLTPLECVPALAASLDGLLLPGGPDIDPTNYGEAQLVNYSEGARAAGKPYERPPMMGPDPRRDTFELALYREFKAQAKPVFGLCRGVQLINVAEGGTLHQEISEVAELAHELDHSGYTHHHEVVLVPGTRVAALVEHERATSPSTHHQAIKELGAELRVAGKAPDGVIEFIEHRDPDRFIVGVQGDVERARVNLAHFERIYAGFVAACEARAGAR